VKVLNSTLWCHPFGRYAKWAFGGLRIFEGGHFGMSITKATQLHKQGLCTMGDFWNPKTKDFQS
jgi:hypothetical protein